VRKELEVARLKSEFVSAVSHEFRSPLSAISHLAELLDAGRVKDEERKREYYGLIRGECGRLRRLVENLLNFARIEEGRQQFRFERMALAPWLRQAVDEFRTSPAAAGKEVVVDLAPDLPPVRADAEAMAVVLGNLLDNAVKYSPDSGRVWVQAGVIGDAVEISVRDQGVGIADEDREHIFDRFYRAHDAGTVAGAGLGLALVQRIVSAHGGTVDVVSRVGEGSTFRVRLPALIQERA
jgi:signal transduction histidine kinase